MLRRSSWFVADWAYNISRKGRVEIGIEKEPIPESSAYLQWIKINTKYTDEAFGKWDAWVQKIKPLLKLINSWFKEDGLSRNTNRSK